MTGQASASATGTGHDASSRVPPIIAPVVPDINPDINIGGNTRPAGAASITDAVSSFRSGDVTFAPAPQPGMRSNYNLPAAASNIRFLDHGFDSLIVAANATFFERDVEGAYRNTVGGLVSGVCPVLAGWPGSMVISADVRGALKDFANWDGRPFDAKGVPLAQAVYDGYYLDHSNGVLWPVMHGLLEHARESDPVAWNHYRNVNAQFASHILDNLRPNNLIWIHDYHLMLTPGMIRSGADKAQIAYFHHIPFPTPADFEAKLPKIEQQALLKGLLGSDLIAFHTMGYVRNFLDSVRAADIGAVVDYGSNSVFYKGRTISVGAFPISVDVEGIDRHLQSDIVNQHEAELRAKYPGEQILFGVERLDYTKGIKERILAMGELLEASPELIGKIRLVQVAAPSREAVEEYRKLKEDVIAAAHEVNQKYGRNGWRPVELHIEKIGQEVIFGYCRAADVVVVTPRVDGMNLVIKEAVLAARERTAFVLGEGAGAAEELREAFLVTGGDVSSIARGYSDALHALETSPETIESRARQLKARVRQYPVSLWGEELILAAREAVDRRDVSANSAHKSGGILDSQVRTLISAHAPHRRAGQAADTYAYIEDLTAAIAQFPHAKIALDYDGCLVPIVTHPEWARIERSGINNLRALTHARNTEVAIISGRSVDQLLGFLAPLKGEPILLCGMHGGEIYDLREGAYLRRLDPALKVGVREFRAQLERELMNQRIPVSSILEASEIEALRIEDKGFSLALHYRSVPGFERAAKAAMQAAKNCGDFSPFEIRHGKMVVELVPRSCTKGNAVEFFFLRQPGSNELGPMTGKDRRLFVAGDDITDESAFRAAHRLDPHAITVRVGDLTTESAARERVPSPESLHSVLTGFTAFRFADDMRS